MVEVVETVTSFSKGFELFWTIPIKTTSLNNTNTDSSSPLIEHSAVFEAFSKRWRIEARVYEGGNDKIIQVGLQLVNNEGNAIKEIGPDGADFEPLRKRSLHRMSISFWSESGKPLRSHDVTERTHFYQFHILICISMNNYEFDNILQQEGSNEQNKFIQMHFEVRMLHANIRNNNDNHDLAVPVKEFSRGKLFDEGKFTDFVIKTSDGRENRTHRLILDATSPYFEAMFNSGGIEAQNGEIQVPELFPVMNEIVRFLYTGKVPGKGQFGGATLNIVGLYVAADKYQVTVLKAQLEEAVNALLSPENVCAELVQAHTQGVECMKAKASEFIRMHQKKVVERDDFHRLCATQQTLVAYVFASLRTRDIVELYPIAVKNQNTAFKDFLESAFEELLTVENASGELVRVDSGGECAEYLKAKAADFIRAHRNEVFETKGWRELCQWNYSLVAYLFAN